MCKGRKSGEQRAWRVESAVIDPREPARKMS